MLSAINPATGQIVRELAPDSDEAVERKLDAAMVAWSVWRQSSFADRARHLRAVANVLRAKKESLATLLIEETGKIRREALGEVVKCAWCCDHYAEHAAKYLETEILESDATQSFVQYPPLGAVLGILPWNSPMWLAFRVCAPALMAGNSVLIKPDPHAPACGTALVDVFNEASVPRGVFEVLSIETPRVERVIRDRRIAAVSFTGSTRGGQAVAAIAGSEVKPAVLELGGSDPALVLGDADLETAAEVLARSRLIAAGQSCIAPKRMIVVSDVHHSFVERMQAHLSSVQYGDPNDEQTALGPLARADLRDELHRQVEQSVELGARALVGGKVPEGPGFFYPATLLTDVTPDMPAFREETFGPVIAIVQARDDDHALELANETDYGLAASIWTQDTERALQLARNIEAGQVVINGIVKTDPRLPSGGIKRSGYGRELGPHGIRQFVNAQQVWVGPSRN